MKAEKKTYRSEDVQIIWDNPREDRKANFSLKAEKGIYPSGVLHNVQDNPKDIIKVKNDMKVRKGVEPTNNCTSQQTALENKPYFPGKPNSGLNRKKQKSQKPSYQIIKKK